MSGSGKSIFIAALLAVLSLLVALWVYRWSQRPMRWETRPPVAAAESSASPGTNGIPVDLETFFNGRLDQQWNTTTHPGDDLAELPRGLQVFDGVQFDIRGVVQLLGQVWQERRCPYPERVAGIPAGRSCRAIYLLHATGGAIDPPGATVARLVLHYRDGSQAEFEIQHDIHVKDWWSYRRPPPSDPNTVVAWTGRNAAAERMGTEVRLYKTRFENPHPNKRVETLDYVSGMAKSGPFMVALTME